MNRFIHRNDFTHGTVRNWDDNGFGIFEADTGARYTVHKSETMPEKFTEEQREGAFALWKLWPAGPLTFRVERAQGRSSKSLIVSRTRSEEIYRA